jgi:hypothetical protein
MLVGEIKLSSNISNTEKLQGWWGGCYDDSRLSLSPSSSLTCGIIAGPRLSKEVRYPLGEQCHLVLQSRFAVPIRRVHSYYLRLDASLQRLPLDIFRVTLGASQAKDSILSSIILSS